MQTFDDVARFALALPEVSECVAKFSKTNRAWQAGGKIFAWERPFSKADVRRFGDQQPPGGPILAVRTADLHEKEAILAAGSGAFFTISHFDGYNGYLIQLDEAEPGELEEALADGFLAVAPPRLADQLRAAEQAR